ncbi:hypothetical protein LCGC14_1039720 [marine sediment metagenome]|uniref:Uncharacterized protein n=1 Tax=marine sediment metagenome TaxID=412755 RepID=A0A0F9QY87_9ZZZZ
MEINFTGIILLEDDELFSFIDKFGEEIGYNKISKKLLRKLGGLELWGKYNPSYVSPRIGWAKYPQCFVEKDLIEW